MLRSHPAEKSQGFSHLVEVHVTLHQTRKSLGIVHLVPEKKYRFRANKKCTQAGATQVQIPSNKSQIPEKIDNPCQDADTFLDRASNP